MQISLGEYTQAVTGVKLCDQSALGDGMHINPYERSPFSEHATIEEMPLEETAKVNLVLMLTAVMKRNGVADELRKFSGKRLFTISQDAISDLRTLPGIPSRVGSESDLLQAYMHLLYNQTVQVDQTNAVYLFATLNRVNLLFKGANDIGRFSENTLDLLCSAVRYFKRGVTGVHAPEAFFALLYINLYRSNSVMIMPRLNCLQQTISNLWSSDAEVVYTALNGIRIVPLNNVKTIADRALPEFYGWDLTGTLKSLSTSRTCGTLAKLWAVVTHKYGWEED